MQKNIACYSQQTKQNILHQRKHLDLNIAKASKVAGSLNDVICSNKQQKKRNKYIYKTAIDSIMTYSGETKLDTFITKHLLGTTAMKKLRRIT